VGLSLWLSGCVPPRQAGGESSLPPLVLEDELPAHEVKEELRWAAYRQRFEPARLLGQAREAFAEEDWGRAHEAAFELVDEHPDAPEAAQVLWIFGKASAELLERDRAQRAMRAALCVEAAPNPLLGGAMPPLPDATSSRCTPGPAAPDDLAMGWANLAEVETFLGNVDAADTAMGWVVASSPPGSDVRSAAHTQLLASAVRWHRPEQAFSRAVALLDEGGREIDVEVALGALAQAIVEDDWNGDGRKDALSGLSRRQVSRWLARDPPGAVAALREAIVILVRERRCTEARRAHARLARLSDGGEAFREVESDVRSCVGR
jgi:hypothetical protein